MRGVSLIALTLLLSFRIAAANETAHTTVVDLTKDNFHAAIADDPANPKWLLKFYAPWCGHCKHLAPVLDDAAPLVVGKLAIGKIDCTSQRTLCDEFNVRSYPTLKFSLDGNISDYPGGRKVDDFVKFAQKLNRPVVQAVSNVEEAVELVNSDADEGVGFLAFDPSLTGENTNDKLSSTNLLQVYSQVARKEQVNGFFLLLDSAEADTSALTSNNSEDGKKSPFVCRLEKNVEPKCYTKADSASTIDMLDFVKSSNVATVTPLGPHNFHKVGRNGRPLVIAVVDSQDKEMVDKAKSALTKFALSGRDDIREKYYYGYFDGNRWSKFLRQFNIDPQDMPQVFALDVSSKTFWQDASYKLDVDTFLAHVEEEKVQSKKTDQGGVRGWFKQVYTTVYDHKPWSIVWVVLFLASLVVMIWSCVSPGDSYDDDITTRPPSSSSSHKEAAAQPNQEQTQETKKEK